MGGELIPLGKEVAEQAKPLVEKAKDAIPAIKNFGQEAWDVVSSWSHRSFEGELNKTESGKAMIPVVQNYIYDSKSDARKLMADYAAKNPGKILPIDAAMQQGYRYNRIAHFGIKDSLMVQTINNAAKERNAFHARTLEDSFKTLVREQNRMPLKGLDSEIVSAMNKVEPTLNTVAAIGQLQKVAIPHMVQWVNNPITAGWKSTLGAFKDIVTNYEDVKKIVYDSNVMLDETLHAYKNETQGIPSWLKKNFNINSDYVIMPFFRAERKNLLMFSANVGRVDAMRQAEELIGDNPARARTAELKLMQYHIDPVGVRERGGKLTEDEINRAMYEQANQAMFIKSALRTPQKWERNSITRALFKYKPYAFQQGKLIKDSILNAYKVEGIKGASKVIATLGTLFPAAGELVWSIHGMVSTHKDGDERVWNGPFYRGDRIKAFEDIMGDNIATEGADEYFSSLAHVAALGMYYQVLRSVGYHSLARLLAGPYIGWFSKEVEDTYKMVHDGLKNQFN